MLVRCNQDDPQLTGGSPRALHSNALSRAQVQSFLVIMGISPVARPELLPTPQTPGSLLLFTSALGRDLMIFGARFEAEDAFIAACEYASCRGIWVLLSPDALHRASSL
jgi:hypothetical protein